MNEDPLWKQCSDWLCQLEVLPPNHRIMWPDASIQDLAYTLRDGVVLCHIAAAIDTTSVDMKNVNQRPQMAQFLCLKNIRTFLSTCSSIFEIKETDLFQASMLYDYTDFARVLHTLSRLSNCAKAKHSRPQLQGFPRSSSVQLMTVKHRNASGSASSIPSAHSVGVSNSIEQSNNTPCKQEHAADEEIYRTLEEVVNEEKYQEFYYKHHGGSAYGYGKTCSSKPLDSRQNELDKSATGHSYYMAVDREEDIYEDLCSFKWNNQDNNEGACQLGEGGMEKLQMFGTIGSTFSTASSLPRAAPHLAQPVEQRDYCIKELVETEGNYVDVLSMLRKDFLRPNTTMKEVDKLLVFKNIIELGEIHATFYKELLLSVSTTFNATPSKPKLTIGEVFLDFKQRFLIYGSFCSDLPIAQQTLDTLCDKDEALAEEISLCERNANGGRFRLRDLLAVPMQRVLKYHLLLRELLSHTPTTMEEYHSIRQAYDAMLDVADFINEAKRDSEQLNIIREIQNSITDYTSLLPPGVATLELKDYGRLRKDGELKILNHDHSAGSSSAKTKVRYVFIFDQVMLMCKAARGDHYTFKDSLTVKDYKVQDGIGISNTGASEISLGGSRRGRDGSTRWAHSFMLVHAQNINALTLFARTAEDKMKWMEAINEALKNVLPGQGGVHLAPSSSHEVYMGNFESGVCCEYCNKLLRGLFYQGYSCMSCHRVMHRDCISLLPKCTGPSGLSQQTINAQSLTYPDTKTCERPLTSSSSVRHRKGHPPALPPRPASMLLPGTNMVTNTVEVSPLETQSELSGECKPTSLSRFSSSCSLSTNKTSNTMISQTKILRSCSSTGPLPMPPTTILPTNFGLNRDCHKESENKTDNQSHIDLNGGNPDYINTKVEDHAWYVGEMDRGTANDRLHDYPVCTFLVRCRLNTHGEKIGYALSLKTDQDVKHMKICSAPQEGTLTTDEISTHKHFYLSDTRKFRSGKYKLTELPV